MKKQFLKILLSVGVLAFAASMSAFSCKVTGGGLNINGGSGNTSVDSNISLEITGVDAALTKVSDNTNIKLKASAFPSVNAVPRTLNFEGVLNQAEARRKKAFDVAIKGATGGLLLTVKGNVTSIISTSTTTKAPVSRIPNDATGNDGLYAVVSATVAQLIPAGLSFFGVFANKNAPTSTTQTTANVAPFAFTSTTDATNGIQPVLWCVATIPGITAAATATSTLEGGHKASCYVASLGGTPSFADATARNAWFNATGNFKRKIRVRFFGIQTDKKAITKIGLPAFSDAMVVTEFNDGLDLLDMSGLVGSNNSGSLTVEIEVVNDANF